MTRIARHNHIMSVLRKLHWLPVKCRAQYKLLTHTCKALYGQSAVYLRDILQVPQNTQLLVIPTMRKMKQPVSGIHWLAISEKLKQWRH